VRGRRRAGVGAAVAALLICLTGRADAQREAVCENYPNSEVRTVSFEGVGVHSLFTEAELSSYLRTIASGFSRRVLPYGGMRRCVSPTMLSRDSTLLTRLYQRTGYPGTTVLPRVTPAGRGRVDVVFVIQEATPVLIDSVIVEWSSVPVGVDTAELRRGLYAQPGRPLDTRKVESDVDLLNEVLRNSGYARGTAYFGPQATSERRGNVTLNIDPGPLVRIGQVVVTPSSFYPNRRPSIDSAAVRPLLGLRTGDLYSERQLRDAQRRLDQLGTYLYSEVRVDTGLYLADSVADVEFLLREDKMNQLDTEHAWATLDCVRSSAQYSNKAFLHTTTRIDLAAQASKIFWGRPLQNALTRRTICGLFSDALSRDSLGSSRLNYSLAATLTQPGSFGGRLIPSVTVFSERRSGYQAFMRETQIGLATTLTRRRGSFLTSGGYSLEYGRTDAEPAVLCFVFRACDEDTRQQLTGSSRPLAVLSLRSSREQLDDPILRTNGSLISVELRSSQRLWGSERSLSFNKATLDASWYVPFPGGTSNTLMARIQAGIVGGGTRTAGARLPPPQERLYAGGPTSVRGYQQNELGAVIYLIDNFTIVTSPAGIDTVPGVQPQRIIPVGGNSLVVGNLEYRVPSPLYGEFVQFVLFTDVGRVWTRGVQRQVGFRWTPGIGVRYISPLGPIQLNAGYNRYDRPAGPAFLNAGISGSGAAPLICVSPREPGNTDPCPSTYTPQSGFRRVVFTLSLGSW
jgi:outer membrane protein assembly factor BamA